MEFLIRTVVTSVIVALVLLAARRLGHRAAGVLAGLPFTTVPALGWTAAGGGTDLAARVAIGTVAGCLLVPLFAMAYDRTARRHSPGRSLVAALAAVACGVGLISRVPASLAFAALICGAGGLAALQTLRAPASVRTRAGVVPCSPTSIAIGIALVGIISAAIAALSTVTTPQFAGLLAGLPTLGLVTIVRLHRAEGAACVTPFLRGYVISTLGRVMFGTVYALMAVAAGSTAAMVVAIVAGASLCLAASCIDGRRLGGRGPVHHDRRGDLDVAIHELRACERTAPVDPARDRARVCLQRRAAARHASPSLLRVRLVLAHPAQRLRKGPTGPPSYCPAMHDHAHRHPSSTYFVPLIAGDNYAVLGTDVVGRHPRQTLGSQGRMSAICGRSSMSACGYPKAP